MLGVPMYHEGSRQLQDRYETRRLADRLVEVVVHDAFTDDDRAFIESRPLFFLATADAEGVRIAHTREAGRASSGWWIRRRWHFPATTATACSRAWGM
jgi:predicted pyridoxine 5'-phosphate oxidase superfamily flavin-nucleotide-binding protein